MRHGSSSQPTATGHLNVRSGVAVVHIAVNLNTKGGSDQAKKLVTKK